MEAYRSRMKRMGACETTDQSDACTRRPLPFAGKAERLPPVILSCISGAMRSARAGFPGPTMRPHCVSERRGSSIRQGAAAPRQHRRKEANTIDLELEVSEVIGAVHAMVHDRQGNATLVRLACKAVA